MSVNWETVISVIVAFIIWTILAWVVYSVTKTTA